LNNQILGGYQATNLFSCPWYCRN